MTSEMFGNALKRHQKDKGSGPASDDQSRQDSTKRRLSSSIKSAFSRPSKTEAGEGSTSGQNLGPRDDANLSTVLSSEDEDPEPEKSAWTEHWEAVNRGEHIGIRTPPREKSRLASYFESQLPKALDRLDLNDKGPFGRTSKDVRIPMDWFRSRLDDLKRKDGEPYSEVDSRHPMILIIGLPAVGKSAVARELANLLEGSEDRFVYKNRERPDQQEAAWRLFVGPSRRPQRGHDHVPGPIGCRRPETSSPVEHFAGGKAVVVNVDHLSYMEDMRQRHARGTGEKRVMPPDSVIQTAGEVWWYCTSLASLQSSHQADPEVIRRLDRGRRLAVETYVMPQENRESTVILTECLYDDDRNGKSETVASAYKIAAGVFERRLIPIYLTCTAEEHQRRLACRQRDAQKNLENVEDAAKTYRIPDEDAVVLRSQGFDQASAMIKNPDKASEDVLYYFSKPADYKNGKFSMATKARYGDFETVDLPDDYQGCRIDTTGLTPLEVASIIQRFCQDVMRGKPLQTWVGWSRPLTPDRRDKDDTKDGEKKQRRTNTESLFIN